MAKPRQDPRARGLLYEGLWQWLLAGKPEAGRDEFSGPFWFQMDAARWHGCAYCDEPDESRFVRLVKIAIAKRLVGLTDDSGTMHDAHNLARVIEVLDEIEPAPTEAYWQGHYPNCAGRLEAVRQLRASYELGCKRGIWGAAEQERAIREEKQSL